MDIGDKARRLERKLARTVQAAIGELVGPADPAPLEIVHGIITHAEQQIVATGRGRRVFPYNRITVRVLAAPRDHAARARVAAVFDGPPTLKERVCDRLRAAGASARLDHVAVAVSAKPDPAWTHRDFSVEYARVEDSTSAAAPEPTKQAPPPLKIAVRAGTAERASYTLTLSRVDLGRRSEVVNARHEVVRTNQVAFVDDDSDVNRTVSRRHAHMLWNGSEYRLYDDRSAHGTRIVRDGRTIPVPAGARGVRVQNGDDILLGSARLRLGL
jgi:hypothetical protein